MRIYTPPGGGGVDAPVDSIEIMLRFLDYMASKKTSATCDTA